ncbi:hypothetical protein ACLKA6_009583 [Drosophila palustris]
MHGSGRGEVWSRETWEGEGEKNPESCHCVCCCCMLPACGSVSCKRRCRRSVKWQLVTPAECPMLAYNICTRSSKLQAHDMAAASKSQGSQVKDMRFKITADGSPR